MSSRNQDLPQVTMPVPSRNTYQFRKNEAEQIKSNLKQEGILSKLPTKVIEKLTTIKQVEACCTFFKFAMEMPAKEPMLGYINKCLDEGNRLYAEDQDFFTANQINEIMHYRKLAYLNKAKVLADIFINVDGNHKHTDLSNIFNIMTFSGLCQSVDNIYYEPAYVQIGLTRDVVNSVIKKNTFNQVNEKVKIILRTSSKSKEVSLIMIETIVDILAKFKAPYNMDDWKEYTLAGHGLKISSEDVELIMQLYKEFLGDDVFKEIDRTISAFISHMATERGIDAKLITYFNGLVLKLLKKENISINNWQENSELSEEDIALASKHLDLNQC